MNKRDFIKRVTFPILSKVQLNRLFRFLNRRKVLILAYHGVTRKRYEIPPWTQIPMVSFEQQIRYLRQKYNVITLRQAIAGMANGDHLPRNPAVITFDDGYKNNLTVALPILQKYGTPATIFITAGYIGSEKILPLDEVYLMITRLKTRGPITISEIGLGPLFLRTIDERMVSHQKIISRLKRLATVEQKKFIKILEEFIRREHGKMGFESDEDFFLLSWEEIRDLLETELIEIGAHTVSHEILTNLTMEEAEKEIIESKLAIQEYLGYETKLFAYPNGTKIDYDENHVKYLRENGFICSLTTVPKLNKIGENPYQLGRLCIGPDYSANLNHFALNVSGFLSSIKSS